MLHRVPSNPYQNLLFSAAIGLMVGLLLFSSYLAIFQSNSFKQSVILLADALPIALMSLPVVVVIVLVYALPVLWLALRAKLASPLFALLVAALPGVAIWLSSSMTGQPAWIALSVSICTGLAFIALAYREPPPRSSRKPNPPRGPA